MSEGKPFPPSDHKLQQLRRKGIIPWSPELIGFGAMAGAAVGVLLFLKGSVPELLAVARQGWSGAILELNASNRIQNLLWISAARLLFPIVLGALIVGLLQSRFLFLFQRIGFRFQRFRGAGSEGYRRSLQGRFALLGAALVWALIVAFLLFPTLQQYLEISFQRVELSSPAAPARLLDSARLEMVELQAQLFLCGGVGLGFLFSIAVVSRFVAGLSFRAQHGMTRAELEAENREFQGSEVVRQRLQDIS